MTRGDITLHIYGKGNRWSQADWLRRLADVLEREALEDGDPPTDPSTPTQVVASGVERVEP